MQLLVGLGNPGASYARQRHNVGFMAVDGIAQRYGFGPWRAKFNGDVSEGRLGTEKVLLLKPTTFMNDSGRSVAAATRFFKIETHDIVVFHDELDLAPGKVRVKTGGGVAGHNGLRSIEAHLSKDFRRVRIGIGHPGDKSRVSGHVLGDFSKLDQEWLDPTLDAIVDEAPSLKDGDAAYAAAIGSYLAGKMPTKKPTEKSTKKTDMPGTGSVGEPEGRHANSHPSSRVTEGDDRPLGTALGDALRQLIKK
ncbi:MAG: aminoacyl-tRNA hydrolase [Pseudomonadota bacterium]